MTYFHAICIDQMTLKCDYQESTPLHLRQAHQFSVIPSMHMVADVVYTMPATFTSHNLSWIIQRMSAWKSRSVLQIHFDGDMNP